MSGQFWLSDERMERLRPHFPKARGKPRVDDRRVLSGILFVLRNDLRWQDAPAVYGPHETRLTTALPGGRAWEHSPVSSETWLDRAQRGTPS